MDDYSTFWTLAGIACVLFALMAGVSLLAFIVYRYGRQIEIETSDPELIKKLAEKTR